MESQKNDKRRSKQRKHKRFSGVIGLKEPENKKIQKHEKVLFHGKRDEKLVDLS